MPINNTYTVVDSSTLGFTPTSAIIVLDDGINSTVSYNTLNSNAPDIFTLIGNTINLVTTYGGTTTNADLTLFFSNADANCSQSTSFSIEPLAPNFTFTTISNAVVPGDPINFQVTTTSFSPTVWNTNNVITIGNNVNLTPLSSPLDIGVYQIPTSITGIIATNNYLINTLDLSIFPNLLTADFSSNQLDTVIIGNFINQNLPVYIDLSDNQFTLTEFWNIINSFTPQFQSSVRTIDLTNQGYTIFDEPGVQDDILNRVLELISLYNIEILGDFDFGNYGIDYAFDYD
jgi:hypothetical protein